MSKSNRKSKQVEVVQDQVIEGTIPEIVEELVTRVDHKATAANLLAHKEELDKLTTMSSRIRYLVGKGLGYGEVSRILTAYHGKMVRYQWVRNVMITPIKKAVD